MRAVMTVQKVVRTVNMPRLLQRNSNIAHRVGKPRQIRNVCYVAPRDSDKMRRLVAIPVRFYALHGRVSAPGGCWAAFGARHLRLCVYSEMGLGAAAAGLSVKMVVWLWS